MFQDSGSGSLAVGKQFQMPQSRVHARKAKVGSTYLERSIRRVARDNKVEVTVLSVSIQLRVEMSPDDGGFRRRLLADVSSGVVAFRAWQGRIRQRRMSRPTANNTALADKVNNGFLSGW